jgi:hypothetical protein
MRGSSLAGLFERLAKLKSGRLGAGRSSEFGRLT